jgi:hypothetical protein
MCRYVAPQTRPGAPQAPKTWALSRDFVTTAVGLQSPVPRFDPGRRLPPLNQPECWSEAVCGHLGPARQDPPMTPKAGMETDEARGSWSDPRHSDVPGPHVAPGPCRAALGALRTEIQRIFGDRVGGSERHSHTLAGRLYRELRLDSQYLDSEHGHVVMGGPFEHGGENSLAEGVSRLRGAISPDRCSEAAERVLEGSTRDLDKPVGVEQEGGAGGHVLLALAASLAARRADDDRLAL